MSNPVPPSLNYASLKASTGGMSSILPSVVLMAGAMALVGLGGCFLIGVLHLVKGKDSGYGGMPTRILSPEETILQVILYLVAFGCFAGAIYLIILAIRWLKRQLASKQPMKSTVEQIRDAFDNDVERFPEF